jgi:hypothetical protein
MHNSLSKCVKLHCFYTMASIVWLGKFDSDVTMFILIVVSIVTLVLETTVARLYIFLYPGPQSLQFNILLFGSGIIIFSLSHILILLNIRKRLKGLFKTSQHTLKVVFQIVAIVQFILSGLLVLVLFQILTDLSYKTSLIIGIVSISYISGIFNLAILSERFIRWIHSGRSYISLLFGFATFSILLNTIITMIFIVSVLLSQPNDIGWHIGILTATFTGFNDTLRQFYSVSFIIAYVVTWFATVTVLRTNSYRLGKVKFWAFVILPLLYIIGEFQVLILPLLSEYRSADPVTFTIVYTLIFNTIKFAGAFFFGIGFWSMARKIEQKTLKSFLNISAYGLILLFVTNQATLLLNTLFPPLGLMTACFVGLSSFLLLVGTYSAAVSVSNDARIRKAIRTSVENESQLIGDIGDAEMQMTLNTKVFSMMNKMQKRLQEDTQVESSLTGEDIKNYTNQVIQELIQRKKSK